MRADLPAWGAPPGDPALGHDEIHVWRASLDVAAPCLQRLSQTLSPDEVARAARYRFPKDRDRFIAARGTLRAILSRYLGAAPEQWRFNYSPHGKPSLAEIRPVRAGTFLTPDPCPLSPASIRFNLSHSHRLALYALARGREVGIDIEYLRSELASESIAERFFSAREVSTLRSLPPALQQAAFFACWTRKEAYLKAVGGGLTIPLDQVEVSLSPEEPAALLHANGGPAEVGRWSLRELAPGAGYTAALAVEGHGWQLQCWDWAAP